MAVLKIDATGLPAATLGDSDQLQVGDTVLAMGDPFGVGLTVTTASSAPWAGRISTSSTFEDFIQTDAPINPGNSGGALVDSEGRVIGINTAILSHSGGSNGVGFAIPINQVRSIAEQLVSHGKVERGYLGVSCRRSPRIGFPVRRDHGALVSDVSPTRPPTRPGSRAGTHRQVQRQAGRRRVGVPAEVSELPPGTEVTVEYLRNGKPPRPSSRSEAGSTSDLALRQRRRKGRRRPQRRRGQRHHPEIRQQLGCLTGLTGAVISDIEPDCASTKAGLARGDVILDLDRRPVHNADEAVRLSAEIKGPKVLVRFWRNGSRHYLVVDESESAQ